MWKNHMTLQRTFEMIYQIISANTGDRLFYLMNGHSCNPVHDPDTILILSDGPGGKGCVYVAS